MFYNLSEMRFYFYIDDKKVIKLNTNVVIKTQSKLKCIKTIIGNIIINVQLNACANNTST